MGKKLKGLQQLSIFEWVEDSSSFIADTFLSLSIFMIVCSLRFVQTFRSKAIIGKNAFIADLGHKTIWEETAMSLSQLVKC